MSELTLIPFGLKLPEQKLVDVSEVERGSKCDCICPSCKALLIARQGNQNEWHFAHNSKNTSSSTVKECKYSFWVSVVLMAKQILEDAKTITLPSLTMFGDNSTSYEVAKKTTVECSDLKIDGTFNSVKFDAIFTLGQYVVAAHFATPHRENDLSYGVITDKVGVLEISLNNAKKWLYGNDNRGNYRKVLEKSIIDDVECKRWINHPRKDYIEKKYCVSLYKERQQDVRLNKPEIPTSQRTLNKPLKNALTNYGDCLASSAHGQCVICGNELNRNGGCFDCQKQFKP